jgi:hypothetical protein
MRPQTPALIAADFTIHLVDERKSFRVAKTPLPHEKSNPQNIFS